MVFDSYCLFLTIRSTLLFHQSHMEHIPFVAKENAWERLKQSFQVYKENFIPLSILIFFYNVVALVVSLWMWNRVIDSVTMWQNSELGIMDLLMGNPASIALIFSLGILGFITYLIFYIPILVWTIKSIRDSIHGEKIDVQANLKYGMSQFFNVLRIYLYIFQYVFLTPALLFIAGLIVLLIALISDIEALLTLWWILLLISVLVFIPYMIYRWLRSTFRLYAAIDTKNFSKEYFISGLGETKWQVWRLFWNFLLVWICIGIFSGIFWTIINVVTGVNKQIQIEESIDSWDLTIGDINELRDEVGWIDMLHGLLITLIEVLWIVFATIFTYILYLRIRDEYNPSKETLTIMNDENSTDI